MATTDAINATIPFAQAYYLELLDQDTALLELGGSPVNTEKLTCIKRLIKALGWDLDIEVNDDVTTNIFELLLKAIFPYNGNAVIVDPSVLIPGRTDVTVIVAGSTINSDMIPFNNEIPALLAYDTTYKHLYGNNPIVNIYVTGFTQEEQTPANKNYQDNDPTKDLLSITWDFPFPVSGFIQIYGSPPST